MLPCTCRSAGCSPRRHVTGSTHPLTSYTRLRMSMKRMASPSNLMSGTSYLQLQSNTLETKCGDVSRTERCADVDKGVSQTRTAGRGTIEPAPAPPPKLT